MVGKRGSTKSNKFERSTPMTFFRRKLSGSRIGALLLVTQAFLARSYAAPAGGAILPALLHTAAEEQARNPRDVGSLTKLLAGGDTVPVSLQERVRILLGVEVREGYGMTEAVPLIFNSQDTIRQGSLGVAITGVQVRIVDFSDRDVPEGEIGEIAVLGPGNC